jgi:hypothetical protein
MKPNKIAGVAVSASRPLAKALVRKKPTVGSIVFGAEKCLPDLNRAATLANDAAIRAQMSLQSGNYREISSAVNQLLQGAQLIFRTSPVELLATSGLPEGVRYREGIALFAEAYDWLQHQQ